MVLVCRLQSNSSGPAPARSGPADCRLDQQTAAIAGFPTFKRPLRGTTGSGSPHLQPRKTGPALLRLAEAMEIPAAVLRFSGRCRMAGLRPQGHAGKNLKTRRHLRLAQEAAGQDALAA
jgi:hypothetical protein